MKAWRSSALGLAEKHCSRALDFLEAGTPYDRSIFAVGTAAHAVLEEIGKAATLAGDYLSREERERVAGETCERLIAEGRVFDGRAELPLPSPAVWQGRDLALRYCAMRSPSPGNRYEIELAVDREWRPLEDPHDPRAFVRAQLDAVGRWAPNPLDENDDGRSPAVEILDFKTAWSASADELETIQRKIQAVVAWAHLGSPELTLRIVVANVRMGKEWDLEIDPNDDEGGGRTLELWKNDIVREIRARDRRDAEGRRIASPGAGCIGCPYLRVCPDAARSIAVEVLEEEPAALAARWCLHQGEGQRLREILEPLADEGRIAIEGGGELGWTERAETVLAPRAEEKLAEEWARRVTRGIPKEKHPEHLANSIPTLLLSLGMTATNAGSLIETIIPADAENARDRRSALKGSITTTRYGRAWKVVKEGGKKPKGAKKS